MSVNLILMIWDLSHCLKWSVFMKIWVPISVLSANNKSQSFFKTWDHNQCYVSSRLKNEFYYTLNLHLKDNLCAKYWQCFSFSFFPCFVPTGHWGNFFCWFRSIFYYQYLFVDLFTVLNVSYFISKFYFYLLKLVLQVYVQCFIYWIGLESLYSQHFYIQRVFLSVF